MFYYYYWCYFHVGFNYNDILSFLFVVGGSVGYGFLKNQKDEFIKNCGDGAIYFGWLGTLIGLRFNCWKMG